MKKDIAALAREAGLEETTNNRWWHGESEKLERFAALVVANNPPQSFMSWQQGYAAGATAEHERLSSLLRQIHDAYTLMSHPGGLKKRSGNAVP